MRKEILLLVFIIFFHSQQLSALPTGFLLIAIHALSSITTCISTLDSMYQNQEEGSTAVEGAFKGLVFMTKAGVIAVGAGLIIGGSGVGTVAGAAALTTGILSSSMPVLRLAYLLDCNSREDLSH